MSDVLLRELRWSRAAPLDLSEEYSLTLAPARSQSLVFSRAAARGGAADHFIIRSSYLVPYLLMDVIKLEEAKRVA